MKNAATALLALSLVLGVSLSCSNLKEKVSKATSNARPIDSVNMSHLPNCS
jgi:hypothetical protein